ncbi:hypothetical protein VTK26DRAFT_436 [Humicola hyalothermophila]
MSTTEPGDYSQNWSSDKSDLEPPSKQEEVGRLTMICLSFTTCPIPNHKVTWFAGVLTCSTRAAIPSGNPMGDGNRRDLRPPPQRGASPRPARQLAPVQGQVVPVCYGEASCAATEDTGPRALVLSDIGGIGLLGVTHDDGKLDNYRLVGENRDRVMVIDFDSSYNMAETEDPERSPGATPGSLPSSTGWRTGERSRN